MNWINLRRVTLGQWSLALVSGAALVIAWLMLRTPSLTASDEAYIAAMSTADHVIIEDTRLIGASVRFARDSREFGEVVAAYTRAIRNERRYRSSVPALEYRLTFYDVDERSIAVVLTDDTFVQFGDTTVKGSFDVVWPLRLERIGTPRSSNE